MTVKYTVVARRNPGNQQAPEKHYTRVKSSGKTTLRQLAQQIGQISTVSSVDTIAVLEALLTVIPQELANGNIVQLGDFGSFSLRIHSVGADAPDEVSAHQITNTLTTFRPGKLFKDTLSRITFEKV